MQDITDLVSDLDYECQDNRNFHNTMRNKFDKIDSNSAEIGELKDLLENLRLQVDNLKTTRESSFIQNALDKIYPVGSVYVSFEERNPSTFLGGNWSQISGRFLLGVDNAHKVGTLGGEEFHKLTTEELPAHNHSVSGGSHTHTGTTNSSTHTHQITVLNYHESGKTPNGLKKNIVGSGDNSRYESTNYWTTNNDGAHTHSFTTSGTAHSHEVTNTGSGQSHNNMPPYIAVYMYRRIS